MAGNYHSSVVQASVVQGYFPSGVPRRFIQPPEATIQPRMVNAGARRPPSYQELTLQAHQRSAGSTLQPAIANGTAFALPPHLVSFDRRPGQQLPSAIQQKMGSFFKADFSGVQVHVVPEALSIGALAFTQGSDIFFAPGQYNPDSHFGQQLLAHELTHVVQQRAGRVHNPFGSGVAVVQDPALEAEAEHLGRQAVLHATLIQSPLPLTTKQLALQRRSAARVSRIGSRIRQMMRRSIPASQDPRGFKAPTPVVKPAPVNIAAPPFVQNQVGYDDPSGGAARALRLQYANDFIQKWTNGTSGTEDADGVILRNYASVTVTNNTGATFTGVGVSSGPNPNMHAERYAYSRALDAALAGLNLNGQALNRIGDFDAATLWNTHNIFISSIYTERELCSDGTNSCNAWLTRRAGGNNTACQVNYSFTYDGWGKRQMRDEVHTFLRDYVNNKSEYERFWALWQDSIIARRLENQRLHFG